MDDSQSHDPAKTLPAELTALLEACDAAVRDDAWTAFIDKYSRLILHAAKSLGKEYDPVMDRYTFVLEQLRRDDFRRLRAFAADGRGKFTTWLTVVTRRLCLDHQRERYGRVHRSANLPADRGEARRARRRLTDLVADELDVSRTGDPSGGNPEMDMRLQELSAALATALEALPPRDRLVLAMRFEDGRPAREIADLMDYPTLFHVYRHVNAVLARLREALERRGIDEPAP